MMAGGWIDTQSDKCILAWMDKDYGLLVNALPPM